MLITYIAELQIKDVVREVLFQRKDENDSKPLEELIDIIRKEWVANKDADT